MHYQEITMENTAKAQPSATMPLLPISNNPSHPILSQSITSRCVAKLVLVHRALLLALGTFTLLCAYTSIIPELPKIRIDSLFMSKLKVSNTSLGANWDVALTIENPNLVSWVRFKRIEGSISYEDNPLSKFPVEPFKLGLKEHKRLRVKISTTMSRGFQPAVKERVFEEMKRQHEDGAMNFNMHLFAWATYSNGWWGTQDVTMEAQCLDLRVGFLPKIGFGSWISVGPMTCSTGSYAS